MLNKAKLPQPSKNLKLFLTSEEGKISKKKIVEFGSVLVAGAAVLSAANVETDVNSLKDNISSIKEGILGTPAQAYSWGDIGGPYTCGLTPPACASPACHGSHSSHASHGSHSSHGSHGQW